MYILLMFAETFEVPILDLIEITFGFVNVDVLQRHQRWFHRFETTLQMELCGYLLGLRMIFDSVPSKNCYFAGVLLKFMVINTDNFRHMFFSKFFFLFDISLWWGRINSLRFHHLFLSLPSLKISSVSVRYCYWSTRREILASLQFVFLSFFS